MTEWIDFSDLAEKAYDLIDLGLPDEARTLLDQHAAGFSGEWELHFLYSRCLMSQNRPREAVPMLHKALRLDPDNIDCLVGLFYAYAMAGRMRMAEASLRRAERCSPGDELVLEARVWHHTETGDLRAAVSCFERLRGMGTDNPEAFRNAGAAYERLGLLDRAAACYAEALELYPGFDEARELLADLYIASGRPGKAIALYRKALEDSPYNIRYLSRLAFCLEENDEHEKAMATAEESVRLYPNSPIGAIDCAYLLLNAGLLDKAENMALKAIDIAPLDSESRRVMAVILSEKGDLAGAEAGFEKALSLDPGNSEVLRDYYRHFRRSGDEAKMEEIAARVTAYDDPSCAEDYWFLADYYREKGNLSKAFGYLHKAYRIRPGEHDLLSMAADILIARGHTGLSLRFLKRYVELTGWNGIMDRIAAYPEMKKGATGEAMRFLRFCGSRPSDYRRHAFSGQFRRAAALSAGAVALAAAFPLSVIFGAAGLLSVALAVLAGTGAAGIANLIKRNSPVSTGR